MWGSAGFVRIYGHMIHRRPTDTAVATGCLYRGRREGYRHGGRQAVRKRQQCLPRTVGRAGHPRPRYALPDCPTLFGTLRLPASGPADMTNFRHSLRSATALREMPPEPLTAPITLPSLSRSSANATLAGPSSPEWLLLNPLVISPILSACPAAVYVSDPRAVMDKRSRRDGCT